MMTNAERVLLLRRARSEVTRVCREIPTGGVACLHCGGYVALDAAAAELARDLDTVRTLLSGWIDSLEQRPPGSTRILADA